MKNQLSKTHRICIVDDSFVSEFHTVFLERKQIRVDPNASSSQIVCQMITECQVRPARRLRVKQDIRIIAFMMPG